MRKKLSGLSIFGVCANLFAIGVSSADLIDNAPSTGDDTLFQGGVNNSTGDPGIFAGTDSGVSFKFGLMAFDVSGIPAGATITGATLDLWVGQVAGSSGSPVTNKGPLRTISLYDEAQPWGVSLNVVGANAFNGGGQGAAAKPGDATWLDASFNSSPSLAVPWSSGKPANITGSSVALATTAGIPGTTSEEVQWSSAGLAAEVQGWVNTPSSNNGLVVVNADSTDPQTFLAFWGAQGAANAGNGFAPDLVVTYSVPEPATFGLVGVAGAGLLLRRRRHRMG